MNCQTCEAPLPSGRLFCPGCGAVSPEGAVVMGGGAAGAPAVLAGPRPTSTSAVVSVVFGVLSYVALPLLGAIIAVVVGHHARRELRLAGGRMEGELMASVGLALGYSQLVLAALAAVALLMVLSAVALAAG